jgi:two-component system phosphate regulon response regulator PhoB
MAERILVIEDEADLSQVLEYNLRQQGYEVTTSSHGQPGLRLLRSERFDLVMLDLMLPDIAGTEICRTIKNDAALKHIPVMMLTAKGEEIDRVVGFELGADDYVTKPFSVRELMLRVQAVLRRRRPTDDIKVADMVEFGLLKIDQGAHRVWVKESEIELTSLEFKLLLTLWQRKNRVQSRAALLDMVWGISADINTRTVDTHVKRLREKLDGASDYIETVRGVGYRFAEQPQA